MQWSEKTSSIYLLHPEDDPCSFLVLLLKRRGPFLQVTFLHFLQLYPPPFFLFLQKTRTTQAIWENTNFPECRYILVLGNDSIRHMDSIIRLATNSVCVSTGDPGVPRLSNRD